ATMELAVTSDCTSTPPSSDECMRSRNFDFTETATAGQWLYIARAHTGWTNSSRGTQVGPLGGSWSAQFDHFGGGGLNCCPDAQASAFLDRNGAIYYVRDDGWGLRMYWQK